MLIVHAYWTLLLHVGLPNMDVTTKKTIEYICRMPNKIIIRESLVNASMNVRAN